MYRLLAAPLLVYLVFTGNPEVFKWLLPVSFFTDLIDGYLARKYNAISVLGSRLDSIADDLTIVAAIVGVVVFKLEFVRQEMILIMIMLVLYFIQTIAAIVKYRKISSFHTYIAKTAAVFQGVFLILLFILNEPILPLFYIAALLTIMDIIEETILVFILPQWKTDIKGLYWVIKNRERTNK